MTSKKLRLPNLDYFFILVAFLGIAIQFFGIKPMLSGNWDLINLGFQIMAVSTYILGCISIFRMVD